MKAKIKNKGIFILSIIMFVISIFVVTGVYAYFTSVANFQDSVAFGTVLLDTTTTNDKTEVTLSISRANGDSADVAMPGDIVTINAKVKLSSSSQPAYYLIFPVSNTAILDLPDSCNAYFYSGSNLYATNGTNTYQVNSTTGALDTTNDVSSTIGFAGSLTAGNSHTINIPIVISTSLTRTQIIGTERISCTICAIQQANLTMAGTVYTNLANLL